MSAYFVAAIGTDIGKTFTTCALVHAARQAKRKAFAYKPVISGWQETPDTDTAQLIMAGGNQWTAEEISPWRFLAPLSPHRAAALEGRVLDVDALSKWTAAHAQASALTLIETVGGVMVPLTNQQTTLNWMQRVGLPVILVTGSYLGSISHTLTAMAALEQRSLHIAGLVMNESAASSVDFVEAQRGLAPYIENIPLRIFQPRVSSYQQATEIFTMVEKL